MVTLILVFVLFAFGSDCCDVIRRVCVKLKAFFTVVPRKIIIIIIIIIYLTANVLSPGGSGYNART
jgi:hypothetical protein